MESREVEVAVVIAIVVFSLSLFSLTQSNCSSRVIEDSSTANLEMSRAISYMSVAQMQMILAMKADDSIMLAGVMVTLESASNSLTVVSALTNQQLPADFELAKKSNWTLVSFIVAVLLGSIVLALKSKKWLKWLLGGLAAIFFILAWAIWVTCGLYAVIF